ncbi:MAG: hypothetical protein NTV21_20485, partial [Planctomycetota bacterium]|nr:hypothetical protein [Planctomycetota bacterium]
MSASRNRNGWGALILSSAISVVAFVAVPHSDSSEENVSRPTGRRRATRPAPKESASKLESDEPAEAPEGAANEAEAELAG